MHSWLKERRSTCHASSSSSRTAPTKRITAGTSGKTPPTTAVRRLSSRLSRSSGLGLESRVQCSRGQAMEARTAAAAASSSWAAAGQRAVASGAPPPPATARPPRAGRAGRRASVRSPPTTTALSRCGPRASRLRRTCTRHRCQLPPCRVPAIAAFSPSCASLTTSCPPPRQPAPDQAAPARAPEGFRLARPYRTAQPTARTPSA